MAHEDRPEKSRAFKQSRMIKYSSAGNPPNGDSIVQHGDGGCENSILENLAQQNKSIAISADYVAQKR